ncbi:hypothetical protein DSO57_1018844 [Entomophthora muscae]|uniref:Uncharacterized protein n=2 Tax=Entomophthora muscae TaxID=34485 RepID=A0ACC2TJV6_9FUNG|nr:hypothetical protein DSO57_1001433 [Entomophthora muscae]KAJ9084952.1 hypothetical protein DSO57_1018844 [Entomophthora muscae]
MSYRCKECETCVLLKKGIVPRSMDFGHRPCASALEACRVIQTSHQPNRQAELLLKELTEGHMEMDFDIYYVDTDLDEEPPIPAKLKNEIRPKKATLK